MEKILVVDFGSQYAHLIAQCVRKLGVYATITEPDAQENVFNDPEIKGIIWSGGPASVYSENAPQLNKEIFTRDWILARNVPLLCLCYGHQMLAQIFAKDWWNAVEKNPAKGEYGPIPLTVKSSTGVLKGLEKTEIVVMSHEDTVACIPPNFVICASTENCRAAAVECVSPPRKIFGLQFHPEVSDTLCGMKIFDNFLGICGVEREWTSTRMFEETRDILRQGIKDRVGILLASGGVDSSVLAELAKQEFPEDRLHLFHIDTGFERRGEPEEVERVLTGKGHLQNMLSSSLPRDVEDSIYDRWQKSRFKNFHLVRAARRFRRALEGIVDPEEKRKIIGELFIKVIDKEIRKLGLSIDTDECVLLQGTIYPDTIESARTRHADRIKTHHNRVDAVTKLIERGAVIEPLQYLYKDEVRKLGQMLKIDPLILSRHPFPVPGLAVRILCSNESVWPSDPGVFDAVGCESQIYEMINTHGFQGCVLPIKSVGVEGDQRTYAFPYAFSGPQNWDLIEQLSLKITNRCKGKINRTLFLVSPANYSLHSISVHRAFLAGNRIAIAKQIDWITQHEVKQAGWYKKIWQIVVVLAPLSHSPAGNGECAIIRFVNSVNAMTATNSRPPWPLLEKIASELLKIKNIEAVFYDPTPKPPATIEWE